MDHLEVNICKYSNCFGSDLHIYRGALSNVDVTAVQITVTSHGYLDIDMRVRPSPRETDKHFLWDFYCARVCVWNTVTLCHLHPLLAFAPHP